MESRRVCEIHVMDEHYNSQKKNIQLSDLGSKITN